MRPVKESERAMWQRNTGLRGRFRVGRQGGPLRGGDFRVATPEGLKKPGTWRSVWKLVWQREESTRPLKWERFGKLEELGEAGRCRWRRRGRPARVAAPGPQQETGLRAECKGKPLRRVKKGSRTIVWWRCRVDLWKHRPSPETSAVCLS